METKRRVTVTVDSKLLEAVENSSQESRSATFELALKLLRQRQIDKQMEEFYKNMTPEQIEEDEWWGELGYQSLMETWDD